MIVQGLSTRRLKLGEDLYSFIFEHIKEIPERSVLVITSKLLSVSQNLTGEYSSWENREQLVLAESDWSIKDEWGYVSYRDGMLVGSAGIDRSNGFGKTLLLPRDCYTEARKIQAKLKEHYSLKEVGVIISDSRSIPLRYGALGLSLGHFGFAGIRNYVGTEDLDGRKIEFERANVVDALTVAAVLEMGETDESKPLALITDAYVTFTEETVDTSTIIVPFEKDRFFKILDKIQNKIKGGM